MLASCSMPFYPNSDFKGKKVKDSAAMHKATMRPYTINGKTYYPTIVEVGDVASGIASWYGSDFHGKKTSNGERYDMYAMTAAHKTLPMNTMVRVVNLNNNKQTIVRINDRGPFVAGRIIDLSKSAARELDIVAKGTAPVRVEVLGFSGKVSPKTEQERSFSGGNFMVQIGAFRKLSGANLYKNKFDNTDGYASEVRKFELNGSPIFRVFLIGFRSENEARDFLALDKFQGAFIVRE